MVHTSIHSDSRHNAASATDEIRIVRSDDDYITRSPPQKRSKVQQVESTTSPERPKFTQDNLQYVKGIDDYTTRAIWRQIVDVDTIESTFEDIAGSKTAKDELFSMLIFPMIHPEIKKHKLYTQKNPVLLFGL